MEKTILHCDLNNFFASVECKLHPEFEGLPVAVCGDPEKRSGIVLAKNEYAKAFGVRTTDIIFQAKQKCPNLVIAKAHYEEYVKYSRIVKNIYLQYTNQVESFGMDECWLDVTNSVNLFGDGEQIANELRLRVKRETGLTISVGVSFNKTLAKLASDLKKPDAVTVISKQNFRDIVWDLDANCLLMVGRKTSEKLRKLNIKTVGDVAKFNRKLLTYHLGIMGEKLIDIANGIDDSVVKDASEVTIPKSVSQGVTLPKDIVDFDYAKKTIYFLCDMIAIRLRNDSLVCGGVGISVKNNEFEYFNKQKSLLFSTQSSDTIAIKALEILNEIKSGIHKIRAITVFTFKVSKGDCNEQLCLFKTDDNKSSSLEKTIDKIKTKYGFDSVIRASYLNDDFFSQRPNYLINHELIPFNRN